MSPTGKQGLSRDGNVTYLGEYAGQASYGLIDVQVPQHHPFSSPIDGSAIKQLPGKIDLVDVSFSSKEDFLKKHRLFLERPVLEDLYWLIPDDYPAAKRHLLKYNGSKTSTDYWVIPS